MNGLVPKLESPGGHSVDVRISLMFSGQSTLVEQTQLLLVDDHLVPVQFDELVLGQEAEKSRLMPDE